MRYHTARPQISPFHFMVSRQESKNRAQRYKNAMQRYSKERYHNSVGAEPGPYPCVLVLDHLKAGFNAPKIFRSAQAFGVREIHLINVDPFDPAPAKGAFRKVPARFHTDFDSCYQALQQRDYTLFTLAADSGTALYETPITGKSAFIFGNEGVGISFAPTDYPAIHALRIPHSGNMESLNVSVAASIVMYEYTRQSATTKQEI